MKHFLLLGMAASLIGVNAYAELPTTARMKVAENVSMAKMDKVPVKRLSADVLKTKQNGTKQLVAPGYTSNSLRPTPRKDMAKSETKEGFILYENFSGWDGADLGWVPDGWTVEHYGDCSLEESWIPFASNPWTGVTPVDGNYLFGILYSTDQQDEWFISPEVELGNNMVLSYWINLDPFWFFSTDNIDWDLREYIGDKVIAYTLQIMIQEEGGEWITLRDYAQEYLDYTFDELYTYSTSSYSKMDKQTVSLDEYSGKKVKVGFRYVGIDGNTLFIDAIGISYPELDNISYMNPFNTLYWGLSNDNNFLSLEEDYALYPVYAPTTWTNMSEDEATFSWQYSDPEKDGYLTSDDQEELTVTYVPDYSSEATLKNNLFNPPTLNASAPGSADKSYTAPYKYFQAGGKPEITTNNGELEFSLFQFGINELDLRQIDVRDDSQGAFNVPVFGYNEFTDTYWLNYSLNGQEPLEGNFSHLIGIGNLFVPSSEADIVAKGINVYGWGRITPEAELSASIYGLNEDWSSDYESFTLIARATISGSEVQSFYGEDSKDYLFLTFVFDQPVAFRANDEHPAYVIMFEGFNSDKVEYFAPLQSQKSDLFGTTFGYILNEINLRGHIGDIDTYYSFKPMVYKEDDEYYDPTGGFAIGLVAEYPWLTTDVEELSIGAEEDEATVALGSYYDGSMLTVETPEGLVAGVTGRYNNCVLTVSRATEEAIEGNIVVKGPGVEVTIHVNTELTSGISELNAETGVKAIYDLSGRKVENNDAAGVYIVKYNNGKVSKVNVK